MGHPGSVERASNAIYPKNSRASATPVTDGTRIYASFGTHGMAAFDFAGSSMWHVKLGDLEQLPRQRRLSRALQGPAVPLPGPRRRPDSLLRRRIRRGDRQDDLEKDRRESVGWGSPIVISVDNHDELIVSSQGTVQAYDPANGEELWTVGGNTFEVIPTPVVGHGLVFCSSGRAGPTIAIRPGGRGDVTETHVAWSTPKGSPFVPSGIIHGELLYLVNDMQSILTAYEAKTGTLRLSGPARRGEARRILVVSGRRGRQPVTSRMTMGETFVVQAGREFKLAAGEPAERLDPRVARARRWHLVLADGFRTGGDWKIAATRRRSACRHVGSPDRCTCRLPIARRDMARFDPHARRSGGVGQFPILEYPDDIGGRHFDPFLTEKRQLIGTPVSASATVTDRASSAAISSCMPSGSRPEA